MKTIQVDMYAVGLGAALLLQFRLEQGQVVTLLADGGMGHGGYPIEGVHNKLTESQKAFDDNGDRKRIDLIVGTHYDGDHLKGLIPIAEDDSIEIGEVWLPPIKDDTELIHGHISDSEDYLALKFYEDVDKKALLIYLKEKKNRVEKLEKLEKEAVESIRILSEEQDFESLPNRHAVSSSRFKELQSTRQHVNEESSLDAYLSFFKAQVEDAESKTGSGSVHESATYDSSQPDALDLARRYYFDKRRNISNSIFNHFPDMDQLRHKEIKHMPLALANIRKSVSSSAITASHLHRLVQALKKRAQPVKPICHYIPEGKPGRFVFDPSKNRFIQRRNGGQSKLILTLLGPSEMLVEKHRDKLPVGTYMAALLDSRTPIHREGITASNQLSYIFTMEMQEQRILVSGDAGCYDFKPRGHNYFPELLKALCPLNVVQVAHHAGHNYDFYNSLLEAGYADQEEPSYLLLSHEKYDAKRPSHAFRNFIAQIRRENDEVKLFFTGKPDPTKVQDYDELICPVVPNQVGAQTGDTRLVFTERNGKKFWEVEKHMSP